jgi:hypothetical protein
VGEGVLAIVLRDPCLEIFRVLRSYRDELFTTLRSVRVHFNSHFSGFGFGDRWSRVAGAAGHIFCFDCPVCRSFSIFNGVPGQGLSEVVCGVPAAPRECCVAQRVYLRGLCDWVVAHREDSDQSELATRTAGQAICGWFAENRQVPRALFEKWNAFEIWRNVSTGAGFWELARMFVAHFTKRHLKGHKRCFLTPGGSRI